MRTHVSVAALRSTLADVLRQVERGHEVIVTRNERTVARLVPPGDAEEVLRLAGLQAPMRRGAVPKVRPVRLSKRVSLTRAVLEDRD